MVNKMKNLSQREYYQRVKRQYDKSDGLPEFTPFWDEVAKDGSVIPFEQTDLYKKIMYKCECGSKLQYEDDQSNYPSEPDVPGSWYCPDCLIDYPEIEPPIEQG